MNPIISKIVRWVTYLLIPLISIGGLHLIYGLIGSTVGFFVIIIFIISYKYTKKHQSDKINNTGIILKGFHSSAIQVAYLFLFVPTTIIILFDCWEGRIALWEHMTKNVSNDFFQPLLDHFDIWLGCFLIIMGAQLIRIYISVEMVENPHVAQAIGYSSPKPPKLRIADIWIRVIVVVILSGKLIHFHIFPDTSTFAGFLFFLMSIYLTLFAWDFVMLFSRPRSLYTSEIKKSITLKDFTPLKTPWLIMLNSGFGFLGFLLLWIVEHFMEGAKGFFYMNVTMIIVAALFLTFLALSTICMGKGFLIYFGSIGHSLLRPGIWEVPNPEVVSED